MAASKSQAVQQQAAAVTQAAVDVGSAPVVASGGGPTMSTTLSSMDALKKLNPDLYNKMLEGLGMTMINEMKTHQERLKKLIQEGENQNS